MLHISGYKISNCLSYENKENDTNDVHDCYYEIFQQIPIKMVTTSQGTKEWHVCRSYYFTSLTMSDLMAVLDRHDVVWSEYLVDKQFYSDQFHEEQTNRNCSPQPTPTNQITTTYLTLPSSSLMSPLVERQLFWLHNYSHQLTLIHFTNK